MSVKYKLVRRERERESARDQRKNKQRQPWTSLTKIEMSQLKERGEASRA